METSERQMQPKLQLRQDHPLSGRAMMLWIIALTIIAAALRLYRLDTWSFWIDEVFSIQWAITLFDGDIGNRPLAFVPTLLGLLAAGVDVAAVPFDSYETWRDAGIDEWNVRLPSAIIGILTVPILGLAARRIVGDRTTLLIIALLAFSTWHLWMSQTARFYVQQFLFYNLALIFYYRATDPKSGNPRDMALAALWLICAIMSQLTSGMILALFCIDYLWGRFSGQRTRLTIGGIAMLLSALALVAAWFFYDYALQLARGDDPYADFKGSSQTPLVLMLGLPYLAGPVLAVASFLGAIILYPRNSRLCIYLVTAALLPLFTFMALGALNQDVHIRYVFVALFPWIALAAVALNEAWRIALDSPALTCLRRPARCLMLFLPAALIITSFMFANYAYYTGGNGYRTHWREAFTYVERRRLPGESITAEGNPRRQGRFYLRHNEFNTMASNWTPERLRAMDHPTWIVLEADSSTMRHRYGWVSETAHLQQVFVTNHLQPFSGVRVYYFHPDHPTMIQARTNRPATPQMPQP